MDFWSDKREKSHSRNLDRKMKEREKRDKYQDFAKEQRKIWNMKVTVIPLVVGALDTVTKGLVQGLEDLEIRGWVKTIHTTILLRSARILRRVPQTWGNLLSHKSREKLSANFGVKNSQRSWTIIIIIIIIIKALHPTYYMYQEKMEEDYLSALKTSLMHRYNDSKTT